MKKLFLSLLILFSINIFGKDFTATFNQPSSNEYQVTFNIDNWNIQDVILDENTFTQIIFTSSTNTDKKGWAELPFVSTSVQLPADKDVTFEITYSEYTDITLQNPLVPSRGVFYRNQDPNTIPYEIDPNSITNSFYPGQLAKVEEPFIIRDVRGTSIKVFPFQYNASKNILRVYTTIQVTLKETRGEATNPLLVENFKPVKEVIGMYEDIFINFDKSRYNIPMADYGEILVICTYRDQETIEPYIKWKREKGFKVYKEVVSKGTNVKNLIKNKYQANNNILFVQLVGDWEDIKSDNYINSSPTDPKMGCVVGSDDFPDIAIGRFSCSNATELETQINKTIKYEKDPITTLNWRETAIGIGSSEGPGDDGETDTDHIKNIYNNKLSNFNYNYFQTNFGWSASASTLKNQINKGASTIMYCGHGSESSFVTTGFNNNNIAQLNNGDMLPFIVSVACVNGAFHKSYDCFAEAWLKKQNGGAIVTWMSTINQPWYPPMRGQDYFYDILVGGFNYNNYSGQSGINTTEQRTTWGSLTVNACNLMLSESKTNSDVETVHTWTTFGDVSLQLRTKNPDKITSSNNTLLPGSPFKTTIKSNGQPVKDALVCISQNNKYYSALTDANGNVSINNDFNSGTFLLVVTAYNTTTIYEECNCVSNSPKVEVVNYSFDGNGLYAGSTASLSLTIKNKGDSPTIGNTLVTLSCSDPRIDITDNSEYYGEMDPNESLTINNGYTFKASSNISNGETFVINVIAKNGSNTWNSEFTITVYAIVECNPVNNLVANVNDNSVTLSWDVPADTETYSYKIYRNGVYTTTVNTTSYTQYYLQPGTYNYCVEATKTDCVAEQVCVNATIEEEDPIEPEVLPAPTGLAATNITETTVDVVWNAVDNATSYVIDIYNNGNWQSFNRETTSVQFYNLTPNTDYMLRVKAVNDNTESDYSAIVEFKTLKEEDPIEPDPDPEVEYCDSKSQSSYYEWIERIAMANVDNESGASNYSDFTDKVINVNKGDKVTVYMKGGRRYYAYRQYWTIWIDFNHDGEFTSDELVVRGYYWGGYLLRGNITIPNDALEGETRMRVSMKYGTYADPCEYFRYGEVEDYTINIGTRSQFAFNDNINEDSFDLLEGVAEELSVYPNPATEIIRLDIDNLQTECGYSIYDVTGRLVSQGVLFGSQEINVSNLDNGVYIISLDLERPIVTKFVKQ